MKHVPKKENHHPALKKEERTLQVQRQIKTHARTVWRKLVSNSEKAERKIR